MSAPVHVDPALRRRAALALLAASVFWGLSFPLLKVIGIAHVHLAPEASSWFVTASTIWPRFVLALVPLGFLAAGGGWRATRREIEQGVALGLFMSAGLVLQVDGLHFTEASTSAFLSQFCVIALPVVVFGRQRRWPPPRFVVATLMVLGGVAVLAKVDWCALHVGRGEIETVASTAFFAVQVLLLERGIYRANRPVPVTLVMFGVAAVVFLVLAFALAPSPAAVFAPWRSPSWVGFTVLLAAVCTFGAFILMNTWQPRMSAAEAGLIYATEPVWASLLALVLPAWLAGFGGLAYANESVTDELLVGGGLITLANLLVQSRPASARAPVSEAPGASGG